MQGHESLSQDSKTRPQLSQGKNYLNLSILQEKNEGKIKFFLSLFVLGRKQLIFLCWLFMRAIQLCNTIFWLKWLSPSSESQEESREIKYKETVGCSWAFRSFLRFGWMWKDKEILRSHRICNLMPSVFAGFLYTQVCLEEAGILNACLPRFFNVLKVCCCQVRMRSQLLPSVSWRLWGWWSYCGATQRVYFSQVSFQFSSSNVYTSLRDNKVSKQNSSPVIGKHLNGFRKCCKGTLQ